MPTKVVNQQIREIEGRPCLVFIVETGDEFYFPAQGIQSIFHNAMRQFNAFATEHGTDAGQWKSVLITTPQTWDVGITDAAAVAIIVDRGIPSEQTFAIDPDHADALGRELIETALRAGAAAVQD